MEAPANQEGRQCAYELDPTAFQTYSTLTEHMTEEDPAKLADLGTEMGIKPPEKKPAAKKPANSVVMLQVAIIAGEEEHALMFKFTRANGSNQAIYSEKVLSDWVRKDDPIATNISLGVDRLFLHHRNNQPVLNSR